jgi:hypothetical protein
MSLQSYLQTLHINHHIIPNVIVSIIMFILSEMESVNQHNSASYNWEDFLHSKEFVCDFLMNIETHRISLNAQGFFNAMRTFFHKICIIAHFVAFQSVISEDDTIYYNKICRDMSSATCNTSIQFKMLIEHFIGVYVDGNY